MAHHLTPLAVQRLAFARQLLARAMTLANEPGILAPAMAISTCHDALEFVLRAAVDRFDAADKNMPNFADLLNSLAKKGVDLPHRQQLFQITSVRNGFKHHATLPHSSQARDLAISAQSIADDICKACFEVSLWSITAVELVKKTRVRKFLTDSADCRQNGNFEGACLAAGQAFALTFGPIGGRQFSRAVRVGENTERFDRHGGGIVNFGDIRSTTNDLRRITGELQESVKADFKAVAEELRLLRKNVELLKLGISLDGLRRFESMLPAIRLHNGRFSITLFSRIALGVEDASFAYEFALDSIIRAQRDVFGDPMVSAFAEVLKESPILAHFVRSGESGEQIAIALPGERYPLLRDQGLGGHLVEISFEGDVCYVSATDVQTVRPSGQPTV